MMTCKNGLTNLPFLKTTDKRTAKNTENCCLQSCYIDQMLHHVMVTMIVQQCNWCRVLGDLTAEKKERK